MEKIFNYVKSLIEQAIEDMDDEFLGDIYSIIASRGPTGKGELTREEAIQLNKLVDQAIQKVEAIRERSEDEDIWNEDEEVNEGSDDERYAEYYYSRFGDDLEELIRKAMSEGRYRIVKDKTDGKYTRNPKYKDIVNQLINGVFEQGLKLNELESDSADYSLIIQSRPQGGMIFEINIGYKYNQQDDLMDVVINSLDVEYDPDL